MLQNQVGMEPRSDYKGSDMIHEHDVVELTHAVESAGLTVGAVGAVVMVYRATPPAYEVEFVDEKGGTIAILTLGPDDIEPLSH